MGGASPNQADIVFPYTTCLHAARDLWSLAGEVESKAGSWATEANKALDGWQGGHEQTFRHNLGTANTDADSVKGALRSTARKLATAWAQARGEQDRINFARWVQAQKDDDGWGENTIEFFAGEDDYGEPPGNPADPQPPEFNKTRDPIHPEYERGTSVVA
jgi:hypothetical protein